MQDINPFLGYLIHEMINFVYILMFNSVENYDSGITSQPNDDTKTESSIKI